MNISLHTDGEGKTHIEYGGIWFDNMPSLFNHLTKTQGTLILHNQEPFKGEEISSAQLIWAASELQAKYFKIRSTYLKARVLEKIRRRKK